MEKLSITESNNRSLTKYIWKLAKARAKMDQSFRRLGSMMNVTIRARNRVTYLEDQLEAVREAIRENQPFRKPREKKTKGIRAIEL